MLVALSKPSVPSRGRRDDDVMVMHGVLMCECTISTSFAQRTTKHLNTRRRLRKRKSQGHKHTAEYVYKRGMYGHPGGSKHYRTAPQGDGVTNSKPKGAVVAHFRTQI